MKEKDWVEAMSLADEKYVNEANPEKKHPRSHFSFKRAVQIAACLCAIGIALYLFVPLRTTPPSMAKYKGSEYYPLIQKLNEARFEPPKYKNNFMRLLREGLFGSYVQDDSIKENAAGGYSEKPYHEVTDNQVEGIIEADKIKRSDRYIYYLCKGELSVYSIDGENSEKVGTYIVEPGEHLDYLYTNSDRFDEPEFFLSEDCSTVTVLMSGYGTEGSMVRVINLDVTDPQNIRLTNDFCITGQYISSRMVDGKLLLFTGFRVTGWVDYGVKETFVPRYDQGNGFKPLRIKDFVIPDDVTTTAYTVVIKLDGKTLAVDGTAAFLSYSDNVYVSENSIIVNRTCEEATKEGQNTRNRTMTEFSRIVYGDGEFRVQEPFTVVGYINNQYNMDEKDGILRVVTSTRETIQGKTQNSMTYVDTAWDFASSANLFCVDLTDGKIVASVERFAPDNETVRSVRFAGDKAYVCTSVEAQDPVFFFDLSDINHITYTHTGTIPGFSTSLVDFGSGKLLGIGRGEEWDSVKLEIYAEGLGKVVPICKYEQEYVAYAQDYKAYFIDREKQLVGLGLTAHDRPFTNYRLLFFDGYQLRELLAEDFPCRAENMRGVLIDNMMYMLGGNKLLVKDLFR